MSDLDKRFEDLVAGGLFSPTPIANVEAKTRVRRRRRVLAVAACVAALVVLVGSAVAVGRGTGSTDLAAGDGSIPGATQVDGSADMSCTFVSLWDVAKINRDRAAAGDTQFAAFRPIVVGRLGPPTSHSSRTERNPAVRYDTEVRSFQTWRTLSLAGANSPIDSVSTQQSFPNSPSMTDSNCFDQEEFVHLAEGQVVVTFASAPSSESAERKLPSTIDAVYFLALPDGNPPATAAQLDDSTVTVRTQAGKPACLRRDPCTLAAFQQELDVPTGPVHRCEGPSGSVTDVDTEPPLWRGAAVYRDWTTTEGCLLRIDVVGDRPGPAHCGWQDARVIVTGSPVGAFHTGPGNEQTFVRDPQGVFGVPELTAGFDTHATLPHDAVDSGYRQGGTQLWSASSDPGAVFVKSGDVVERWPRGRTPLCQ